jgi:Flp pilus assembly protein TadD
VIRWENWQTAVKAIDDSQAALEKDVVEERVEVARNKDSKRALALLAQSARKAVEVDPANWRAWRILAGALYGDDKKDESLAAARTAVRMVPTDDESLYVCAAVLAEKGESAESLEAARRLIALRPTGLGSHRALGLALCSNGDYVGAMEAFREEVRLHPEDPKTKDAIDKFEELKKQGSKPHLDP